MTKFFLIIFFLYSFLYTNIFAKNSFFAEGEKLYKEKKFSQSKFKFEKDIVFNPKNEKSYLYLAKIFNYQKDDFMEEQNLNTVILLNPRNEEALYLLVLLNIKKSDYIKSKKLINDFKKVCNSFCLKESELKKKLENLEPK
ncbi:MAG: hypothetical protein CBD56_01380 [Candidatus Pelagibacter sp. TMED196]|nr:MAG: hypothetical protein CBD56_01380 [Candidatus Pelagibacter sp. TMED196]